MQACTLSHPSSNNLSLNSSKIKKSASIKTVGDQTARSVDEEKDDMRSVLRLCTLISRDNIKFQVKLARQDDHDKRQPSTSLSDGTIHFISSFTLTTCNDIIFIHQDASIKDKRAFLMEKYAFS
jgi:hypothetical protein